jgi:hypothetical protein
VKVVHTRLLVIGHTHPRLIGRWSGVPEDQDVGCLAVVLSIQQPVGHVNNIQQIPARDDVETDPEAERN